MILTNFFANRARKAVNGWVVDKAAELTNEAAKQGPVIPPPVFRSAADMLADFEAEFSFEKGYDDGLHLHSHEAYQDAEARINHRYKRIMDYFIAEAEEEVFDAENTLDTAGANTEREKLAKRKLAKSSARLAAHRAEKDKMHLTDETSRCKDVLSDYRRGYNAGHQKYILTKGTKE